MNIIVERHEHETHESDGEPKRKLLDGTGYCHDMVDHAVTLSHHYLQTHKSIKDSLLEQFQCRKAEKQQLNFELGKKLFISDKQKRNERVAHAIHQNSPCTSSCGSYACTGEENPPGGTGKLRLHILNICINI